MASIDKNSYARTFGPGLTEGGDKLGLAESQNRREY